MSRTLAVVVALAFLSVACGDDDGGNNNSAGSDSGGAGAGAAGAGTGSSGTAGNPSAGTPNGGSAEGGTAVGGSSAAGGSNAAGGSGGQLSGDALKQATYTECESNCELVKSACPTSNLAQCVSTCHDQADNAESTGKCAQELYDVLHCINTTQKKADVTCGASGPDYAGCKPEFMAYYACAGA